MAAFANSADMVNQYDERTLGQLCSDNGEEVFGLASNGKMTAALNRATGAIKAACHVARIYSTAELEGLTGESLAFLKSLTCELAMAYLLERRPEKWGDSAKQRIERADSILDMFRRGERVFDIDAQKSAGLPTIGGPSSVDVLNLNLITSRTRNFYPNRAGALPLGRG